MADRLQELLQQRALIKEHLAWLEGEIAAASGRPGEMRRPLPAPLPTPAPSSESKSVSRGQAVVVIPQIPVAPSARVRDETDELIAQLAAEEKSPAVPDQKGCWIFFCVSIAVVGLIFWMLVRIFYRG